VAGGRGCSKVPRIIRLATRPWARPSILLGGKSSARARLWISLSQGYQECRPVAPDTALAPRLPSPYGIRRPVCADLSPHTQAKSRSIRTRPSLDVLPGSPGFQIDPHTSRVSGRATRKGGGLIRPLGYPDVPVTPTVITIPPKSFASFSVYLSRAAVIASQTTHSSGQFTQLPLTPLPQKTGSPALPQKACRTERMGVAPLSSHSRSIYDSNPNHRVGTLDAHG
jgi:hypothetical protein